MGVGEALKERWLEFSRIVRLSAAAAKFVAAPIVHRATRWSRLPDPKPVRFRRALEGLGLTYLKLGQFLALRHDVLPAEVCAELDRLFEHAPPMDHETVRGVLERELDRPPGEVFERFDPTPVASASVAQVHEARLWGGGRVAVKVQRPGIERIFRADMRNLRRLAGLGDLLGLAGKLSLREAARQFEAQTRRELDFLDEARAARKIGRGIDRYAVTPSVDWELSTSRVLIMEFIDGVSLSQLCGLLENGSVQQVGDRLPELDLHEVLHNLSFASLHQFFVTGHFHGDPHPGNVFVLPDNRVALLDFGIYGTLNPRNRKVFRRYTRSLAVGNVADAARQLEEVYSPSPDSDALAFRRDTLRVLTRWREACVDPEGSLRRRHVGRPFQEMLGVVRRHRYRTSMDNLIFWRAFMTLDSVALKLSPQFDLLLELERFFEETESGLLATLARDWSKPGTWVAMAGLVEEGAVQLQSILSELSRGELTIQVQASESPPLRGARNRRTRLVVASILAAGVLVFAAGAGWENLASVPAGRATSAVLAGLLLWIVVELRRLR